MYLFHFRSKIFAPQNSQQSLVSEISQYELLKYASTLLLSVLHMNFYREAARILDQLDTKKRGSLKSIVFDANSKRSSANQKRLYALLSETLKGSLRSTHRFCSHERKRNFRERNGFIPITQDRTQGSPSFARLLMSKG
jgi:hypothetical protein